MAKTDKADMSCARVKKYTASDVSKAERHNERKNETYENMNVIEERIPYNVHFKKPTAPTYMEQLKQMETDGQVSLRGLRKDATLFNEIVIDVNTMYFERNGGYEYAKQFYEEAYHFIEEKFGADNVISAVMHADEINVAASEELGKEVYHYHLHAMVLPVVEKEILWSKRCKDEKLRGTVKEVVNQISHSKKWKSDIPMTDEKGNPLLRKNGKPMFRASYSILQDELFHYMTEQGFKGFQRGEYGSTAEHLTSLQYQIQQDKERLEKLQKRIQKEQVKYEPARHISKTLNEIDSMGQKTFTGKMAISQKDYSELTALAKEGITSRAEIKKFEQSANFYRQKYMDNTKIPFITSDVPIIVVNPLGVTEAGLEHIGEVIFFPISESKLILCYDSKVYGKIRDNIDEEDTIHTFNKYQYVSAGERILSLKSSNFLVYTEDEELNKIRNRFQLKTKTNTTCDGAGTFIAAKGRSINYYYDIPILKLPIQLRKIPEKYRKTFSRKYSRETRTFLLCQIYRQPDFITNDVIKKDWKDRQKYSKQLLRYFDYYWQTPKEDTVIGKDYMYKLRTVPVKMWKTEMEDN